MMLHKVLNQASELLFPRDINCVVCGKECGQEICDKCKSTLPYNDSIRTDIEYIKECYAPFDYEKPMRDLIHAFKYENKQYLASFFALYMAPLIDDGSIIVPVPLHKKRLRERGYSQTHRLCNAISLQKPLVYLPKILLRTRNTPSQTKLNAIERKSNIEDAFDYNQKRLPVEYFNKKIYLIDDVASTGSTLFECAHVLYKKGFTNLYSCVIAT